MNSTRSHAAVRRFLIALAICGALTGCGGGGSRGSGDSAGSGGPTPPVPGPDVLLTSCPTTSSIAPVVTPGAAVAAPSDPNAFYSAIYNTAAFASGRAMVANPLTVTPLQLSDRLNPNYSYRQAYARAVAAYVWGLPLELFWVTQGLTAKAGINQLSLVNTINTSALIVAPNTSVLYANGFFDLSQHPYLFTYPRSSINNILQIMDPYTNVQGSVGTRVNPCGGYVVLYWAGASYADHVRAAHPNNSIGVYSPQAWLIGRVAVDTYAVQTQGGTAETPYQQFIGSADSPLALWKSRDVLSGYSARALTAFHNDGAASLSPALTQPTTYFEFYRNLAQAVEKNGLLVNYGGILNGVQFPTSTVYDQTAMFANFAGIGLTSSEFSIDNLTPAEVSGVSDGYVSAKSALSAISRASSVTAATNYWSINNTLGQYAPTYAGWIAGASVALVGLGANLAADGTYPKTTVAIDGASVTSTLTGASGNKYYLDFSRTGTPPLMSDGYWSITVYDARELLYVSNANAYYYTKAIGGVYSLGSIQFGSGAPAPRVYLQHTPPTDPANLPFWIPVPDSPFSLVMRIYNPIPATPSGVPTILNPYNGVVAANSPQWIPPAAVKY